MGMKTVTLNDIEGVPRVGVVLRIEGLPADLPWSRVMMYSKTQTEMKVVLLGSGAQLRDGHARSVYTHRVNKRTQERSALLRTGTAGLLKTPTYEELLAKKKTVQDTMAEEERQAEIQRKAAEEAGEDPLARREAVAAAPQLRQTSSRIVEDDDCAGIEARGKKTARAKAKAEFPAARGIMKRRRRQ
eukprot:10729702-Lingulodinium_polyedra.AAC.2